MSVDDIVDELVLRSRRGADVLAAVGNLLAAHGDATAREDAEFLLAEVLGLDPIEVRDGVADDAVLTIDELASVVDLTARAAAAGRS